MCVSIHANYFWPSAFLENLKLRTKVMLIIQLRTQQIYVLKHKFHD